MAASEGTGNRSEAVHDGLLGRDEHPTHLQRPGVLLEASLWLLWNGCDWLIVSTLTEESKVYGLFYEDFLGKQSQEEMSS